VRSFGGTQARFELPLEGVNPKRVALTLLALVARFPGPKLAAEAREAQPEDHRLRSRRRFAKPLRLYLPTRSEPLVATPATKKVN